MQVTFSSIDDQLNRVQFSSEVKLVDHHYCFEDKSSANTMIHLWIETHCIHLKRTGQVVMDMLFDPEKETLGTYQNEMGLELEFVIRCIKLSISPKQIMIQYEMKQDSFLSKHKISFLFH